MDIKNALEMAASLATIVTLPIVAWQLAMMRKEQRRLTMENIRQSLFNDKDVADLFCKIDHEIFKYKPDENGIFPEERDLDKLLSTIQAMTKQHNAGILTKEDIDCLSYHATRIFNDNEIKKYLNFLDIWFREKFKSPHPYRDAEIRWGNK